MAKCKQCGREMVKTGVSARIRSKYCSNKCKQASYRNRMKPEPISPVTASPVTLKPVTPSEGVTSTIEPAEAIKNFGLPDCECKQCQINRRNGNKHIINHGPYKAADQLTTNEYNRVPLPGDPDYIGIAVEETEKALGLPRKGISQ